MGDWLDEWLDKVIKPPRCANSTYVGWQGIIRNHLKRAFGHVLLQQLTPFHIEGYFAEMAAKSAPKTIAVHSAILTCSLKAAVKARHLRESPMTQVTNRPKQRLADEAASNVWNVDEARCFMSTLKQDRSTQYKAFFALALDTGMRKGELLGLKWSDLSGSRLRVERQLLSGGFKEPTFSTPKNKRARVIDLSEETVQLLLAHKRQQAEVKMANRTVYSDFGLIFAQAWEELRSKRAALGAPLSVMSVMRKLDRLCTAAKVRNALLFTAYGTHARRCSSRMVCHRMLYRSVWVMRT